MNTCRPVIGRGGIELEVITSPLNMHGGLFVADFANAQYQEDCAQHENCNGVSDGSDRKACHPKEQSGS